MEGDWNQLDSLNHSMNLSEDFLIDSHKIIDFIQSGDLDEQGPKLQYQAIPIPSRRDVSALFTNEDDGGGKHIFVVIPTKLAKTLKVHITIEEASISTSLESGDKNHDQDDQDMTGRSKNMESMREMTPSSCKCSCHRESKVEPIKTITSPASPASENIANQIQQKISSIKDTSLSPSQISRKKETLNSSSKLASLAFAHAYSTIASFDSTLKKR